MRRDPGVLLRDIERAAEDIADFTKGLNRDTYVGDKRTQAAVERKFAIIGEALNRLRKLHPEYSKRIPPLRKVVGFRNVLIHDYEFVVAERVWDHAENELPKLLRIVQSLLAELGPPER